MSTGGNVVYATSVDVVQIIGTVLPTGAKFSPSNSTGKWTSSRVSLGRYAIVFKESYVQFLGAVVTPISNTAAFAVVDAWTPGLRTLDIFTFDSTGAAADSTFAFLASFSESKAP